MNDRQDALNRHIRMARERADKAARAAEREAIVRTALEGSFPQIPQPSDVFFPGTLGKACPGPEVWATWDLCTSLPPAAWRDAWHILEAFDWQTVGINQDTFTTIGPEDAFAAGVDPEPVSGPKLTLTGGEGYGPTLQLAAWTRLSALPQDWLKVMVRLERTAFPTHMLPRLEEIRDHRRRIVDRRWELPRVPQAYTTVNFFASKGSYHRAWLFGTTSDWEDFREITSAELGD